MLAAIIAAVNVAVMISYHNQVLDAIVDYQFGDKSSYFIQPFEVEVHEPDQTAEIKSGAVDDATTPLCFTVVRYNAPNQSPGSAGRYSAGK